MKREEVLEALEAIRGEMFVVGLNGTADRLDILIASLKAEPECSEHQWDDTPRCTKCGKAWEVSG